MQPVFKALSIILTLTIPLAGTAFAQEIGIAVSQAPEAGTGVCFAEDAKSGFACAQAQCAEEGGYLEDCQPNLWCLPAAWSIDIFMQHQEGPHWHDFSCGWQTREQAEAAVEIKCAADWLIECAAVRIWTPDGEEIDLFE